MASVNFYTALIGSRLDLPVVYYLWWHFNQYRLLIEIFNSVKTIFFLLLSNILGYLVIYVSFISYPLGVPLRKTEYFCEYGLHPASDTFS